MVVPSPNWPSSLSPIAHSEPSALMKSEYLHPVENRSNVGRNLNRRKTVDGGSVAQLAF